MLVVIYFHLVDRGSIDHVFTALSCHVSRLQILQFDISIAQLVCRYYTMPLSYFELFLLVTSFALYFVDMILTFKFYFLNLTFRHLKIVYVLD